MPGRAEGSPVAVAVHHVPVAAAVIDAFGLVLEANAAFGELLGRQPVGERVADLVEPVARPRVRALLADVGAGGPALVRFLGDEVLGPQVEVTVAPSLDGRSSVLFASVQVLGTGIDEALALRAPDLLGHGVVIGNGSRVLHVSEAAAEIFGRPGEELLARGSLFGFFEAAEQERMGTLIAECLASGAPVPEHFDTVVARPDGSLAPGRAVGQGRGGQHPRPDLHAHLRRQRAAAAPAPAGLHGHPRPPHGSAQPVPAPRPAGERGPTDRPAAGDGDVVVHRPRPVQGRQRHPRPRGGRRRALRHRRPPRRRGPGL